MFLALGAGACAETARPAPVARPRLAAPAPATATADALEEDGAAAILADCGFRLVVNSHDAHFTIDLTGTSLRSENAGERIAFVVDDLTVQLVNATRAQIGAAATGKSGTDLLRAHAAWEGAFIAKQVGIDAAPREIAVAPAKGAASARDQLIWWIPTGELAQGTGKLRPFSAFATIELGDQVVGLTATAQQGLEPIDVVSRLARWMATLAPSPSRLSARAVSAEIRRRSPRDAKCLEPSSDGILGIDRRLRFDRIPRSEREPLIRMAERAGGVERQNVDGRLRYRNHACRFELTYPDRDWADFSVQDVNKKGCAANIMTPLLADADTHEQITNAVALFAVPASGISEPRSCRRAWSRR